MTRETSNWSIQKAEFDDYASDYDGGADAPLKRLLGDELFMEWKVAWLDRHIHSEMGPRKPLSVLDFGCGTGLMLALWRARRPHDSLAGTDVSEEMLKEAVRRWPDTQPPDFRIFRPGQPAWPHESFDLVTLCCVLHHVPPDERDTVLREAFHVLKPGGRVCVFEHNPRNFLVRYVVRNAKIDRNAILLRAEETTARLKRAGYAGLKTSFILFFPPFLKMFAKLEGGLAWLPLGGQHVVTGFRPSAEKR